MRFKKKIRQERLKYMVNLKYAQNTKKTEKTVTKKLLGNQQIL